MIYESSLYHHGVAGQKWGQRNGPPYPLSGKAHSVSEEKAGWRKSLDNDGKEQTVKKRTLKETLKSQEFKDKSKKGLKIVDEEVIQPEVKQALLLGAGALSVTLAAKYIFPDPGIRSAVKGAVKKIAATKVDDVTELVHKGEIAFARAQQIAKSPGWKIGTKVAGGIGLSAESYKAYKRMTNEGVVNAPKRKRTRKGK